MATSKAKRKAAARSVARLQQSKPVKFHSDNFSVIPLGRLAAEVYKHLGRGAIVNEKGFLPWYHQAEDTTGATHALVKIYDPSKQYVVIDVVGVSTLAEIRDIEDSKLRVRIRNGTTVAEAAKELIEFNDEIIRTAFCRWSNDGS